MDRQQGQKIVDGLKQAQAAGAPVVELEGDAARNFAFVKDPERKVLLGSFSVLDGKFFVSVASTPRSDDSFQFHAFEKLKGNSILTTITANDSGIVWSYSTSKQDGKQKNEARKQAFLEAAKSDSIVIPFPAADISAFSEAVNRAIELRHLADAAAPDDAEDDAEDVAGGAPHGVRYWKIAPGKKGVEWDECRKGGYIGIGWNKLGDLTNVTEEEFNQRAEEVGASDQVWTFRNIQLGDRIVANAGTKRVLGIGTVIGTYYFDENGGNHKHRLRVQWDDTTERMVKKGHWRGTLIRIKPEDFKTIESAPPVGSVVQDDFTAPEFVSDEEEEGTLNFEAILEQLRDASLSFSAELVASYLLALQAKRFVLLTGISGTGKTQLALEVARAFDEIPSAAPSNESAAEPDSFEIVAKPYHVKYLRVTVPAELAQEFEALHDATVKRLDVQVPGIPRASMAIQKDSDGSSFLSVLLSGGVREWFKSNIKLGDRFQLSRQVGGGVEWLDLKVVEPGKRARPTPPAGRTYASIAVRPSWTDKSEILGFYNPLTNKYQSTKVLEFLLRAHAEQESSDVPRPYFLIFDEMNLARVEHYFSDFLSVMESGHAIDLHDDPQLEDSQGLPRQLAIPRNLFVIGTVNIDETTYMFSPKVLDRAFVLEFNDVNFDGIGRTIEEEEADSTPLALAKFERLEMRGKASEGEWQEFEKTLDGEALAIVRSIHDALAVEHRHFGYRVAREIARFVDIARTQTSGAAPALRTSLDVAVLAKVLPKLHGSQGEMEEILKRLLAIAAGVKAGDEVIGKDGKWLVDLAAAPLPRTARKLERMLRRVRARGFVSFIE